MEGNGGGRGWVEGGNKGRVEWGSRGMDECVGERKGRIGGKGREVIFVTNGWGGYFYNGYGKGSFYDVI